MKRFLLVAFLFVAALRAQEAHPQFGYSPTVPFDADGKCIAAAWQNADQLGRFNIPAQSTVATYNTTVQMLYDDNCLYITFRGRFEPQFAVKQAQKNQLWHDDNYEILINPDPATLSYSQIAVSWSGDVFFAQNGGTSGDTQGITTHTYASGANTSITNVTIPLAKIGLDAATMTDKQFRFNFARTNRHMPNRKAEHSSYVVLESFNYHNLETWATGQFTRTPGTARFIMHDNPNVRVNLIANYNFNIALDDKPVGWNLDKNSVWMETILLSNTYMVRSGHNAYVAMTYPCDSRFLKPGKEYTFRIRARRVGDSGNLGVITIIREDGRTRGKTYTGWHTPLTTEWHDYFLPFKMDKNFWSFAFYRLDASPESCVDYQSVQLYEGRVSTFEIRKTAGTGMRVPVGDPIATPANIIGKLKTPFKLLAIGKYGSSLGNAPREVAEIVNGLGIDCDYLGAAGTNSDIYYSPSDADTVTDALDKGAYDVYLLGRAPWGGSLPVSIGQELSNKIIANVESGATLVLSKAKSYGSFKDLLQKYPPKPLPDNHYLRQSLPLELFRLRKDAPNPLENISEAPCGKGRILLIDVVNSPTIYLQIMNDDEESLCSLFPSEQYTNAWLARMLYYAARPNSVRIKGIKPIPDGAEVAIDGQQKMYWQVTNRHGECVQNGETTSSIIRFNKEKLWSGKYLFEVWAKDDDGSTLDYANAVFNKEGPVLVDLQDRQRFYSGNDQGDFQVQVKGLEQKMTIAWMLEDFSGRILEQGSFEAQADNAFKVPLQNAYTNLLNLEARLLQNDRLVDVQRMPVIVQDRDRKRLGRDFCLQVWGYNSASRFTAQQIEKQTEKLGIQVYIPDGSPYSALKAGKSSIVLTVGSSRFFARPEGKNNIRVYELNTAKAREAITKATIDNVRSRKWLGHLAYAQNDESELVHPGMRSMEVDSAPENIAEFRKRMEAKYSTIEALNQRWKSNYATFEDIQPVLSAEAKAQRKYAEFIEWRNFNCDRWTEAHRLVADLVKQEDPGAPFSFQNSYGQSVFGGNDYWRLMTEAGFDFSTEYGIYNSMGRTSSIRHLDEFIRSFRPEMTHRPWGGFSQNPDYAKYKMWRTSLHRFAGFTHYCLTGSSYRLLDSAPSYAITKYANEYTKSLAESRLADGLGKLFLEYEWKKRDIAVYYSFDSMYTAFLLGPETRNFQMLKDSPLTNYYTGRQNVQYLLEGLLYQYDFVSYEQVSKGILKDYKALILPSVLSMSDAEVKAVNEFSKSGGIVIADLAPAGYDELAYERPASPLNQVTVLGKVFDDKDSDMCNAIATQLSEAGLKPIVAVDKPMPGREAMHFVDGDMHLFAVLRDPYISADDATQTISLPVKGHLYDLRKRAYLGVADTVTTQIPRNQAVVFGVYPYQIKELLVKTPQKVAAGTDLKAAIEIVPSTGKAGKHIFHIEVRKPKGEENVLMRRNEIAENGKLEFTFRIAHNDVADKWTLRVTDILSGIVTEQPFTVE